MPEGVLKTGLFRQSRQHFQLGGSRWSPTNTSRHNLCVNPHLSGVVAHAPDSGDAATFPLLHLTTYPQPLHSFLLSSRRDRGSQLQFRWPAGTIAWSWPRCATERRINPTSTPPTLKHRFPSHRHGRLLAAVHIDVELVVARSVPPLIRLLCSSQVLPGRQRTPDRWPSLQNACYGNVGVVLFALAL